MKAFLSYSHSDKEFVEKVAKALGRQYCVFDQYAFNNGDEIKEAIVKHISDSTIFVFFASQTSIKSAWVNYEVNEAWFQKLNNEIKIILVYILDPGIEGKQLPKWLSKSIYKYDIVPKAVARDIKFNLDEIVRQRQSPLFVGRAKDQEILENALTPVNDILPHVFFITGLPGIGKRSFIKSVAPNILNLRSTIQIEINEGDSINEICIKTADLIESYSTREGFDQIISEIRSLDERQATERILKNLREIVKRNDLPLLTDEGGALDNDGFLTKELNLIISNIATDDEIYLCIITLKYPKLKPELSLPIIKLDPLGIEQTKRLIAFNAKKLNLNIDASIIAEIADYVQGYPPAAYYAIFQAKNYGMEIVISDKHNLVKFRANAFLRHITKLNLDIDMQAILKILAIYSPLTTSIMANVIEKDINQINSIIIKLIDMSLIIITEDGLYAIAGPIADAALMAFGQPTEHQNKKIAELLASYLGEGDIGHPQLELSRLLFRASRLSGKIETSRYAVQLTSDIIDLTETFYHERKYDSAIEYGKLAISERPQSQKARSFLIRAFIQEEKWPEAENHITELTKYGSQKEVYFLRGFLARRRGDFGTAIREYKKAESAGRHGIAIIRELAFSLFSNGQINEARDYLNQSRGMYFENPYIVDLSIIIACRLNDEKSARLNLGRLKIIDRQIFYFHRLSRVEIIFDKVKPALEAALNAYNCDSNPPFEVVSQLVCCEIESHLYDDAEEHLNYLEKRFGGIRHDLRVSLRCRLENKRRKFMLALNYTEKIRDKSNRYYVAIRRETVENVLNYCAISDSERLKFKSELDDLNLEKIDYIKQSLSELDDVQRKIRYKY
jgi:hypothetical protein